MDKKPLIAIIGLSGESLFFHVNHFHKPGETIISDELFVEPGGKGFNQAVALAKLSANVAFLSAVGNDDYGNKCEQTLKDFNIKPYLVIKENESTAKACIITDINGDTKVTVFPGAQLALDDEMLFAKMIMESDALLLQMEVSDEVLIKAVEIAQKSPKLIVLNPAPYRSIPEYVFQHTTILTPNENEARLMVGLNEHDVWENVVSLLKKLQKTIIVTMGNKGAYIIDHNEEELIPAPIVKCIDSTGAGDAFNAALVDQLTKQIPLKEAIKYANVVAAMSVTKSHVLQSYPTMNEVKMFLKDYKNE
ncbi:MAG: ribokinase [Bacilli bacterium]